MSTKGMVWYNYRTGESETGNTNPKDHIPQSSAAQGLYDLYVAAGETPLEAMRKTLLACVGETDKEEAS